MTVWKCSLLVLLVSLSMLVAPLEAAIRLGLMVTDVELAAWRNRKVDNATTINGFTYQSIYQNRLLAHANSFMGESHPGGDGYWAGHVGAGCVPYDAVDWFNYIPGSGSTPWANSNGGWLTRAAFVALVDNNLAMAQAVASEILAQTNTTTTPGTDFGNTAKWCQDAPTTHSGAYVYVTNWAMRIVLAYDYLLADELANGHTLFSAGEKTQVRNWMIDMGVWFQALIMYSHGNAFSHKDIFDTPPGYTCYGTWCTDVATPWYVGQPTVYVAPEQQFFGQPGYASTLLTMIGIQQNHAAFLDMAYKYFIAYIRVGTLDNGAQSDFRRWQDCSSPSCPGSMWSHQASAATSLVQIADMFARNGDASLYDYSHAAEMPGASGTIISLQTMLDLFARMATRTTQLFTTDGLMLTWDTEPSDTGGLGYLDDFGSMAANMYYQNANISAAMNRLTHGDGSNTAGAGCFDTNLGAGCFSTRHSFWPDLPFMYGNLAGVIDPYNLAVAADPTVTITSPTSNPTLITSATPLAPALAGTATDSDGTVVSVTWSCPTCTPTGGTATFNAPNWSVTTIGLASGANSITVTATDNVSNTGSDQIVVTLTTSSPTILRLIR